jgi:hypothetical protein
MQTDGNLVIYKKTNDQFTALWATNTAGAPNGPFTFINQYDGNMVVYDSTNKPIWATNTNNGAANIIYMQGDGNLVVYDPYGKALWARIK